MGVWGVGSVRTSAPAITERTLHGSSVKRGRSGGHAPEGPHQRARERARQAPASARQPHGGPPGTPRTGPSPWLPHDQRSHPHPPPATGRHPRRPGGEADQGEPWNNRLGDRPEDEDPAELPVPSSRRPPEGGQGQEVGTDVYGHVAGVSRQRPGGPRNAVDVGQARQRLRQSPRNRHLTAGVSPPHG